MPSEAFAGSLYSAMVPAGWLFVSAKLKKENIDAEAVATAASIQYIAWMRHLDETP